VSLSSENCVEPCAAPRQKFVVQIALAVLLGGLTQGCPGSRRQPDADASTDRQSDPLLDDAGNLADASVLPNACKVTAPSACTKPSPRFADVQPIFETRCGTCHSVGNPDGNWPLNSYEHVADWNLEIRDQISRCTMPPPVARVPITRAEREKILLWLRCGFPK